MMDLLKVASLKSMLYVLVQSGYISDVNELVNGNELNVTEIEIIKYGLDNRYEFRIFSVTPCGYATRITDVRIIIDNEYLRNDQRFPKLATFAYLCGMGEVDSVSDVEHYEDSLCTFVYGNHMGKEIKINFELINTHTYY